MKTRIMLLQRNKFADTNGKNVSYCMVHFTENELDDENNKGFEIGKVSCKYENFDKIKPFVGKDCNVEFEYIKNIKDNTFKRKIVKIDNVILN